MTILWRLTVPKHNLQFHERAESRNRVQMDARLADAQQRAHLPDRLLHAERRSENDQQFGWDRCAHHGVVRLFCASHIGTLIINQLACVWSKLPKLQAP